MRRALVAGMAGAILVLPAVASAAAAPSFPDARLQGTFELAGRVTAAHAVSGEHVGQTLARVWSFSSTCPTGQCAQIALVRSRGAASDSLTLARTGPGRYSGSGSFFLPLRCAGRVYAQGEQVPFTINVRITLAVPFGASARRDPRERHLREPPADQPHPVRRRARPRRRLLPRPSGAGLSG